MRIGKTYYFEAAHSLPGHNGKCRNLHGHSYKLEVTVEGGLLYEEGTSDDNMVMDFADLDALVKPMVALYDHTNLNDHEEFKRTTAEGILLSMADFLRKAVEDRYASEVVGRKRIFGDVPHLVHMRLWETEKSFAEWGA